MLYPMLMRYLYIKLPILLSGRKFVQVCSYYPSGIYPKSITYHNVIKSYLNPLQLVNFFKTSVSKCAFLHCEAFPIREVLGLLWLVGRILLSCVVPLGNVLAFMCKIYIWLGE